VFIYIRRNIDVRKVSKGVYVRKVECRRQRNFKKQLCTYIYVEHNVDVKEVTNYVCLHISEYWG